jgi:hypothetical protein
MVKRTAVMVFIGLMSFGTAGFADEGKDESGKGKQRYEERKDDHGKGESYRGEPRYEGRDRRGGGNSYFHQHGYTRIPNGHLPPPGECRIWWPIAEVRRIISLASNPGYLLHCSISDALILSTD